MSDPDHPHMCAPKRCKNRSPRYLRNCMLPRNAARRHVCEQAAEEPTPADKKANISGMSGKMQGNSPPPGSERYGNRGDLLGVSLTRMVQLDVTFVHTTGQRGGLRAHTRKPAKVSGYVKPPREGTMQRLGHRGTPMQLWRMRPKDDWGSRPRNRSGS